MSNHKTEFQNKAHINLSLTFSSESPNNTSNNPARLYLHVGEIQEPEWTPEDLLQQSVHPVVLCVCLLALVWFGWNIWIASLNRQDG